MGPCFEFVHEFLKPSVLQRKLYSKTFHAVFVCQIVSMWVAKKIFSFESAFLNSILVFDFFIVNRRRRTINKHFV